MLTKLIVSSLAVFITAYLLPGVTCDPWWVAIIVAVVMGLINITIKPVLKILALPITIITLGIFSLIINGLMVELCSHFVDGFNVSSFLMAVIFSVVLALVNWVLDTFVD